MEGLIMSRGVTLAPEAGARARVVHSSAGFEGGNDGFLVHWEMVMTKFQRQRFIKCIN